MRKIAILISCLLLSGTAMAQSSGMGKAGAKASTDPSVQNIQRRSVAENRIVETTDPAAAADVERRVNEIRATQGKSAGASGDGTHATSGKKASGHKTHKQGKPADAK